MNDHLRLLLRLHDGDDRCGCLSAALESAVNGADEASIATLIEDCLKSHPAGSRYRT